MWNAECFVVNAENGRKRQEAGEEEFRESYAGTLFTTVRYKFPMKRATTWIELYSRVTVVLVN